MPPSTEHAPAKVSSLMTSLAPLASRERGSAGTLCTEDYHCWGGRCSRYSAELEAPAMSIPTLLEPASNHARVVFYGGTDLSPGLARCRLQELHRTNDRTDSPMDGLSEFLEYARASASRA